MTRLKPLRLKAPLWAYKIKYLRREICGIDAVMVDYRLYSKIEANGWPIMAKILDLSHFGRLKATKLAYNKALRGGPMPPEPRIANIKAYVGVY